ncbi:hypothetical protein Pelo_10728 [Pelomyxa schiedti]|nr:hypothetical protein Pelo_10728 [Pelomyxa schiedti]
MAEPGAVAGRACHCCARYTSPSSCNYRVFGRELLVPTAAHPTSDKDSDDACATKETATATNQKGTPVSAAIVSTLTAAITEQELRRKVDELQSHYSELQSQCSELQAHSTDLQQKLAAADTKGKENSEDRKPSHRYMQYIEEILKPIKTHTWPPSGFSKSHCTAPSLITHYPDTNLDVSVHLYTDVFDCFVDSNVNLGSRGMALPPSPNQ